MFCWTMNRVWALSISADIKVLKHFAMHFRGSVEVSFCRNYNGLFSRDTILTRLSDKVPDNKNADTLYLHLCKEYVLPWLTEL